MDNEQSNAITQTKQKEFQVIVKPSISRKLLKLGHQIIDIKPNKDDPKATVHVFLYTEKLKQDLIQLTKNKY